MKYKVLVLCHQDLVPPEDVNTKDPKFEFSPWITEYDVITTLRKSGHNVLTLGVYSDLMPIREAIENFRPNVVFNLLEEFDGEVLFDQNVVSYLELLRMKYTGCNPRGLILARDKALAKKILSYHRIGTSKFQVFRKMKKKMKLNKKLNFPLIVKCLNHEASLGISGASVVKSEEKVFERVQYLIDKYDSEVIVEEFIEGREFYVGVFGNKNLKTLPIWELRFENVDNPEKELYSERAKWNKEYRDKKGISSKEAKLEKSLEDKIKRVCKRTYKSLNLTGYARIDLRVTEKNEIFVLEVNPNPNIAKKDEFALSAKTAGLDYTQLLEKLIKVSL